MTNDINLELKQSLEKLGLATDNINISSELDFYKYVLSNEFVKLMLFFIKDNNLIDIISKYIETARHIAKCDIYDNDEIVEEVIKLNIVKSLNKNGYLGVINLLEEYTFYL